MNTKLLTALIFVSVSFAAATPAKDARKQAVLSIQRYVAEELEQDIGDLKAGLMLDFFLKEIAPTVYNGAVADAQTYMRDRLADLEGACSVPEFTYWPRASVRLAAADTRIVAARRTVAIIPISTAKYIGLTQQPPQPAEVRGRGALRALRHAAVEAQHRPARGRQRRPAAARSAPDGVYQRLAEALVHDMDQAPRTHVRHAELRGGVANRAAARQRFEEIGLAGTEDDDVIVIHDAKAREKAVLH